MNEQRLYIAQPLAIFALLATSAFIVVLYVLVHAEHIQRKSVDDKAIEQFAQISELQLELLAGQLMEYADWEEAVFNILIESDKKWWDDNAGKYSINALNLDLTAAISGKNVPIFLSTSAIGDRSLAHEGIFYNLLHRARERIKDHVGRDSVVKGFIYHRDKLYYLVAAAIRNSTSTQVVPDMNAVMVFAREASAPHGPLSEAQRIMSVPKITLSAEPDSSLLSYQYTLLNPDVELYAQWPEHDLGVSLTKQLAPALVFVAVLLAALVLYAFTRARLVMTRLQRDRERFVDLYQRSNLVLESATDGVIGVGTDGRVRLINSAAAKIFNGDESRVSEYIRFQISDENKRSETSPEDLYQRLLLTMKDGQLRGSEREMLVDCHRQRQRIVAYSIAPLRQQKEIIGAMAMIRDVTRLHVMMAATHHRARYDELTGLANRQSFAELFAQAAEQRGEDKPFHLALFNLDRFKGVNETVGHHTGDLVLKEFSQRLLAGIRGQDIVARLGSDEFIVAWTSRNSAGYNAEARCTEIINACNEPFRCDGRLVWCSVSVGLATWPGDGATLGELLRNATHALRHVKGKGGNGLHVFDSYLLEARSRWQEIEHELQNAVDDHSLRLFYQPIYRLEDGELSHFEALLRWHNEALGAVSPAEFIPVAERTGLIVGIGQWVLDECCRQVAQWRRQGWNVRVAVNVSGRQIPFGLSPQHIEERIRHFGIPPGNIKIELTESTFMGSSREVGEWIAGIHALGMEIALDDFGTGFSSLSYLKKYHLQNLKVDQSFVREITTREEDQKLVTAILAMARGLGMPVIAEGVETIEQLEWLKRAGCDMVQGYYYSRPVPADEIEPLLTSGNLIVEEETPAPQDDAPEVAPAPAPAQPEAMFPEMPVT